MQAPSREDLARSGTLEELYGKLGAGRHRAGLDKKVAVAVAGPEEEFRAGALDATSRRAARSMPPAG